MKYATQCIYRLHEYRDTLLRLKSLGAKNIFSEDLAQATGATSVQVRKDFSTFGISGNKRGGYKIDELINQIDHFLGKDNLRKVVIIGAGNIGRSLMNYDGFEREQIKIEAIFDIDPMKIAQKAKPPILPMEDLRGFVIQENIKVGIIAVPYFAAQQTVDLMVDAGMKGALNFAPVALKVPENFFVNNVNLRLELEMVNYFSKTLKEEALS